jgi:hypothetical protein
MSNKINIRFASKEEGQQLIKSSSYYNRLTQMDIDWRAKKQNASLAELIAMAQNNVRDFTDADKDLVIQAVKFIESRLDEFDCQLPLPPEIIFVNTTMEDEGSAGAYTSGNMIVLNQSCIVYPYIEELIAHELFHCITRHSPEFRQKMYSLIGFTVMHPTSGRRWVVIPTISMQQKSALAQVGVARYGDNPSGSLLWADCDEFVQSKPLSDVYQVFGHSQQFDGRPVITPHYACLDCRTHFVLKTLGN